MAWMRNTLASTILYLFTAYAAADGCAIVYGDDWAFLSATPKQWTGACGNQAMEGTEVTLWPSSQKPGTANALIYVTVNGKNFPTLQAFSEDEQARFKASSPTARISKLKSPTKDGKPKYILVRLSGTSGNREELEAYFDGPTAYFIVVLTAESSEILDQYKGDFVEYISSFFTMEKRDAKNEPDHSLKSRRP